MMSPKSVELKQGAEEPSVEEGKRCEFKLPVEIKRTGRIRCGGRVPIGAISSLYPVKEEKVPTPVRRLARIRGMKRKDYKELSPERKDYGVSDYSDDRSPSSWAAAEREDNDLCYWEEVPKEKTPEGPNGGGGNDDDGSAATAATTAATTTTETLAMTTLSGCIRCVVRLAVTPSQSSTHRSTSVS
jgi:hypothetical protein